MQRTPDAETEQNLRDAGCTEEIIRRYDALTQDGSCYCERMRLLKAHRCELLKQLHDCQRKLDCLDFLLYKLRAGHTEDTQQ